MANELLEGAVNGVVEPVSVRGVLCTKALLGAPICLNVDVLVFVGDVREHVLFVPCGRLRTNEAVDLVLEVRLLSEVKLQPKIHIL